MLCNCCLKVIQVHKLLHELTEYDPSDPDAFVSADQRLSQEELPYMDYDNSAKKYLMMG